MAAWVCVALWVGASLSGSIWFVALIALVFAAVMTRHLHGAAVRSTRRAAQRAQDRRIRRRARLARASAEQARGQQRSSAFEAIAAPVLATDAHGRVVLCNQHARSAIVSGEPIGRRLDEVLTHAELLAMHEGAACGTIRRGRVTLALASAPAVYEVTAAPIPLEWDNDTDAPPADRRHGVVLTFQDITELAQAMQLKTDFVANASHELRTPLASVAGAIETLESINPADEATRQRVMTILRSNVDRLADLLGDLLDLSRLESVTAPEPVGVIDLAEVVSAIRVALAQRCDRRGVRIELDGDAVIELRASPRLFTLVLRNLLDNATRFATPGTTIRVTATPIEREPARESGALDAAAVRIEVIDRGIGIPLADQPRIFERFYQVDPARTGTETGSPTERGTGLGLAIVKHAVRVMGGTVGIESVWHQGTTVWFELP